MNKSVSQVLALLTEILAAGEAGTRHSDDKDPTGGDSISFPGPLMKWDSLSPLL